ncbi:MAG TPA: polysaccharide deacetylase family protein [Verrucomicrobiae bacterium]|nr:polysaccharide deacetylase family protein [Verrucomicrobiae bacterium]
MMLVLTYHEVRERPAGSEPAFYAISPAQFERQLEILRAQGFDFLKLEDVGNAAAKKKCVLTFDDATSDHFETVLPILEKYHCHASFFVPTAKLNNPGYLTDEQVRKIAAAGHEIGSHSHEHQRMDKLSVEEVRRQISLSREILAGIIGKKPVSFVPPGGFINERIQKVARELGIKTLRTMRWGYNQKLDVMALETVPINRYTDEKKFRKLLEPRGHSMLYAGKEMLKRVISLRNYERLRSLAFKFWKFN